MAMPPDTSIILSSTSTNPSLTSLPVELQVRILNHLCDDDLHQLRSFLRGSNCSLFYRYFEPQITLDGAEHVHAPFSKPLLAPALASPTLAAAVNQLVDLSYLTDLNTEGQLALWLHAFGSYVQAVSTGHIAEASCASLSTETKTIMLHTLCCETLQLFKAITINHVKLHVLDLVHVPFHNFHPMYDHILSGLCAALESTHNTLRELALPVYPQSDLCARALEMIALPHLTLLSIELKNDPHTEALPRREEKRLRLPFLRMMQAVDGHADRALRRTTLSELRLINLYRAPCTDLAQSGCSAAFFRAVKVLRAVVYPYRGSDAYNAYNDISFFLLFTNLESLFWNRKPHFWCRPFLKMFKRLDELHLCERRWITGVQVGAKNYEPCLAGESIRIRSSILQSHNKIITLMTRSVLDAFDIRDLGIYCPDLQYLSLYIDSENVHELRGLIRKCSSLTGLEIIIAEDTFGRLGKDGWHALGNAIPRSHAYLAEVAIQTKRCMGPAVPVDIATDCFVNVVKRIGCKAERLLFRALVKTRSLLQTTNAVCRIVDACIGSSSLRYLEVDIRPRKSHITPEGIKTVSDSDALTRLRNSKDELLQRCEDLGKIDFGWFQSERIV